MTPEEFQEPVQLPITDVLDLHSVAPADVGGVVEAWLEEVQKRGFKALRIIHGRGIGAQRQRVHNILRRHPAVVDFGDALSEAGGWGATVITIR